MFFTHNCDAAGYQGCACVSTFKSLIPWVVRKSSASHFHRWDNALTWNQATSDWTPDTFLTKYLTYQCRSTPCGTFRLSWRFPHRQLLLRLNQLVFLKVLIDIVGGESGPYGPLLSGASCCKLIRLCTDKTFVNGQEKQFLQMQKLSRRTVSRTLLR